MAKKTKRWTPEEIFLELKQELEDYESCGCRITKKSIREFVEGHWLRKELDRHQAKVLKDRLIGIFFRW